MGSGWQPLMRDQVKIEGGFWRWWRDLVGETTLAHQVQEMRADGHLDAMLLDRKMHRGRELADPWAERKASRYAKPAQAPCFRRSRFR